MSKEGTLTSSMWTWSCS